MTRLSAAEALLALAVALLSAAAVALWLLGYPLLAGSLAPGLAPLYRFERFYLVPIPADRGTVALISGAIVAALVPVHLAARSAARRREQLEEQVAELLAVYAGVAASSRNTFDALMNVSEMVDPPLSRLVERMARLYRAWGDLDRAFHAVASRIPRAPRLFMRAAVTIGRMGGDPGRVLSNIAAYARETRRLHMLVRGRLSEYKLVVALASLTYAVAAGVVQGLVEVMQGLTLPGAEGVRIDPGLMLGLYYYSLLMVTVASAVVMSRVIEGSLLYMPKYVIMLLSASTIVFLASPLLVHPG